LTFDIVVMPPSVLVNFLQLKSNRRMAPIGGAALLLDGSVTGPEDMLRLYLTWLRHPSYGSGAFLGFSLLLKTALVVQCHLLILLALHNVRIVGAPSR
jgi:hypothetical protein